MHRLLITSAVTSCAMGLYIVYMLKYAMLTNTYSLCPKLIVTIINIELYICCYVVLFATAQLVICLLVLICIHEKSPPPPLEGSNLKTCVGLWTIFSELQYLV